MKPIIQEVAETISIIFEDELKKLFAGSRDIPDLVLKDGPVCKKNV